MMKTRNFLVGTTVLSAGLLAGAAGAAGKTPNLNTTGRDAAHVGTAATGATRSAADQRNDAEQETVKAMRTVQQMKSDPQVKKLLSQAKGVFLVPDYGRAALGVGGSGGAGVMLARQGDSWGEPLFYNMGSISIGAQAGGSAGQIALILMNQKAVDAFRQNNKFSLDAKAGLTIIDYSARGEGAWGRGDIVLWSDTEGAYAGASLAVSDINFDEGETRAYYGKSVEPSAAVGGTASARAPKDAQALKQALSQ